MTPQNAFNIFLENGTDKDKLTVSYGLFLNSYNDSRLSNFLKNNNLSGDPASGLVRVRRFNNATVENYGTAKAGTSDAVKSSSVDIPVITRKEIIESIDQSDFRQYGVSTLFQLRAREFGEAMAAHMDDAFFALAETSATAITPDSSELIEQFEELVSSLQRTYNANSRGISRRNIDVVLRSDVYGQLLNKIHMLPNPNGGGVAIPTLNGVRVHANVSPSQTSEMIAMVNGAIAQPGFVVDIREYDVEKSVERDSLLVFQYGIAAVAPDLIKKIVGTVPSV
jgi:hypothetical protein